MYLIFDLEDRIDPIICRDKAMVEDVISELGDEPFQVLTIDVDEMCRDVTADFIPDDEEETAFGIPSPDSLRRWHNSMVL